MIKKTELNRIKRIIVPILRKNNVIKAGIFGSYARGKQKKGSDVDILIKFKGDVSLLKIIGIEYELKEKIGKKVDLITYRSLHPLLKDRILREEVRIL
ncbi:MAG TPA: nucleotidyltransferase family protein [Candidatus Nanoarchaeia archaeon]|nr:nucleotidyltransferase family protein [Candidatus Nanoarchaeia archaeon]